MSGSTAVIVAAHNAEASLDRALRSALAQPETAEVYVVDDASNDDTRAIAEQWARADRRVQVGMLERNSGPGAARNIAIANTGAPWIAILDADDYMLPGRLGALHRLAGRSDFIADALMRTTADETPAPVAPPDSAQLLDFPGFVLGNLGARSGPLDLGYLKPMFRRAFLDQHGLLYRSELRLGEDYEFYARALLLGARFLTCAPAGYVSVERSCSLSKVHGETELLRLRDCDDGLAAVRPLTRHEARALKRHWHSVDCRVQWLRLIAAVKQRDLSAAATTFRSPQAVAFLAARLGEQAWLRSIAFARSQLRIAEA